MRDKLEETAFLELKDDAYIDIDGEKFKGYLPLPINTDDIVNIVKEDISDIPIEKFIEGMVTVLSLNPQYEYNAVYKKILDAYAKDTKSYLFKRALGFLSEEDFEESLLYLNLLINSGVKDARIYFTMGNALENIDISDFSDEDKNAHVLDIMNLYEDALNIDENFYLAHYKLGYIYKDFGQYIKSKISFEKVLELDKNDFRLQEVRDVLSEIEPLEIMEKSGLLLENGKYEDALENLLKVDQKSRDDMYYYYLSVAYANLNDLDAALDAISEALEKNDLGIYHNQLALIFDRMGDTKKAISELENTIDLFGPDYYLNYNLATMQYNSGNIDAAIGNFEIANEQNPNEQLAELIDTLKSKNV